MDNLQRELQETHQLYTAALAENRGLRKRLKSERDVVRGIFKGLIDAKTAERIIAHLDLLVAKSEAAAPPDVVPSYDQDDGARGEQTTAAVAVDAETVAFLKDVQGYLSDLAVRRTHTPSVYERLLNDCTAALARAILQPAATPAQPVVDPEVLEAIARVERMLVGHVVGTRGIEATEGVIADAVACFRVVLAVLHTQAVSPKATPVVPEWLQELELIQRDLRELYEAQRSGGIIDLWTVFSRLGKLIIAYRHPGAKATV